MADAQVSSRHALIVERDLFFSVRLERGLASLGYSVDVAGSRAEAIDAASARPPDLAIINFARGYLDPAATCRQLKALSNPPRVLGFISHKIMAQARPAAIEAGCDLLVANSALTMRLEEIVARVMAPHTNGAAVSPARTETVDGSRD